jgi:hypothetical protein
MNRWTAVAPEEAAGAWEGELRLDTDGDAKLDKCGHLHGTSAEAMRCAQMTARRRNQDLVLARAVPAQRVPPGYYLG